MNEPTPTPRTYAELERELTAACREIAELREEADKLKEEVAKAWHEGWTDYGYAPHAELHWINSRARAVSEGLTVDAP